MDLVRTFESVMTMTTSLTMEEVTDLEAMHAVFATRDRPTPQELEQQRNRDAEDAHRRRKPKPAAVDKKTAIHILRTMGYSVDVTTIRNGARVTAHELLQLAADTKTELGEDLEARSRRLFRMMDPYCRGVVTRDEFRAFLRAIGVDIPQLTCESLVELISSDEDGLTIMENDFVFFSIKHDRPTLDERRQKEEEEREAMELLARKREEARKAAAEAAAAATGEVKVKL